MVNKRNTAILNNKKILHKHGKQWITISIALLGAFGLGNVATHTAQADSTTATKPSTEMNMSNQANTQKDNQTQQNQPTSTEKMGGQIQPLITRA